MVELIEYVIVFGISAGAAGAALMLVHGMVPGLNAVAAASESDQIAGAARIAVAQDRNVTLLLPLHDASVSCQDGELTVSTDENSRSYSLYYPCHFQSPGLSGDCSLAFFVQQESIQFEAKC